MHSVFSDLCQRAMNCGPLSEMIRSLVCISGYQERNTGPGTSPQWQFPPLSPALPAL